MREDTQDLRRRSYRMIKDNFIAVRGLQLMGGMRTSLVLEILANVFRLTGDGTTYIFLIYTIKLVKEQERKDKKGNND